MVKTYKLPAAADGLLIYMGPSTFRTFDSFRTFKGAGGAACEFTCELKGCSIFPFSSISPEVSLFFLSIAVLFSFFFFLHAQEGQTILWAA